MIELKHLSFSYHDNIILNDMSYCFENNKIYGIIGKNGVGKTTLFECIASVLNIKNGMIFHNDMPIENDYLDNDIILLNNETSFWEYLSVKEHFDLLATYQSSYNKDEFISLFHLDKYLDYYPLQLSFGTLNRFMIAIKLFINNGDFLADEPFIGLDYIETINLKKIFLSMKDSNRTILISSHDISILDEICDELLILKDGKLKVIENIDNYEDLFE